MKKTLIAAAVAAAVAAPAASAGVVIYGKIHASINYSDIDASFLVPGDGTTEQPEFVTETGEFKGWTVDSNTSRIGFKGSEDLGNGLKAIWKLENTIRITDTSKDTGSFGHSGNNGHWGSARNAYIGLAGDWGTFLYGRHDTPYKMGFYSTGIDMLGDSVIDVNRLYGIIEVRADDAIAYVSPNWNGLTLAAAIVPGEGYTNSVDGEVFDGIADNYSISAMYSNNGLKLAAGYEVMDQGLPSTDTLAFRVFGPVGSDAADTINAAFGTTTTDLGDELCAGGDCTNTMFGAGYSMNAFDISATYHMQEYGDFESDVWAVSAAYTFGNNKVIGTFGQNDYDVSGTNVGDLKSYGLALQHMFSKRTSAYLAWADSELDLSSEGTDLVSYEDQVLSFGMIHKF